MTMNPSNNATVDNLIQWLAHSQRPLPSPPVFLPLRTDPGVVTIEALLSGRTFTPQPRQSTVENCQASSLIQFLQQRSSDASHLSASVAPLVQDHDCNGASLLQDHDCTGASLLQTVNALRGQVQHTPVHRVCSRSVQKGLNQRQEFFVLVKFLLKVLKDNEDMDRLVRAKAIIAECTHRNRNGDTAFSDLQASVQSRLRRTVGEVYWSQAKDLTDRARRSTGIRQGVVAAV